MSLIERYIDEVSTYLPKDLRDEVGKELRSNLEESLERRLADGTGDSRDDIEIELLTELGPPHQLADSYVPKPRVLFGPRLYPPFLRTMKIAVVALVALNAVGIFVKLRSSMTILSLGSSLVDAFTSVLTGSLLVLGIAVVVFSIIERTAKLGPPEEEAWDPRSLPDVEDPDNISLGDQVASIGFLVVALVVVNLFRDRIAYVTLDDESGWVPLLSSAFDAQLWLLNVCLVLDLIVNFVVLLRWRWSMILRWANIAVNSLYVFWLWRLVSGPSILGVDPQSMIDTGWSTEAAAKYEEFTTGPLARVVAINLKLGFVAACGGLAYSLFKVIRRMFR